MVFTDFEKVELIDKEVPALEANQVLVETHVTLISVGTELSILEKRDYHEESKWGQIRNMPFTPGYNNVGRVIEIGPEVDPDLKGKRVASWGGHAKYVVCNTDGINVIPEGIDDDHAVFFTMAQIVMNGIRRSKMTLGDRVAVFGLGLLGQLAAQIALLSGASKVIGVDVSEYRLHSMAQSNSVIQGINPTKGGVSETLKLTGEETDKNLVDIVFEVTGNPQLIPGELEILRQQGKMVILSSPRGKVSFDFHDYCNAPCYTFIGAHNRSHTPVATFADPYTLKRDAELFFELLQDHRLQVDTLISHKIQPEDAPSMYKQLLKDRSEALGVLIKW